MLIFFFLGITACLFQLVVLREFTYSLAKNELSFILAVGVWLIACSLGSLIAKKRGRLSPAAAALLFTLAFLLVICGIHLAKSLVGLAYYEAASLLFVFTAATLLITPVGFLTGYSFSAFSRQYLARPVFSRQAVGKFFAYEAAGFLTAGVLFTLFFSSYTNPFVFSLSTLLFLPAAGVRVKIKISAALIITFLTLAFSLVFKPISKFELGSPERFTLKGSSYGPVILAEKFQTDSFYLNGSLAASSEDEPLNEEFIHSVFAANPQACEVLLVGCGFGEIRQILKHRPKSLECLDLNPVIADLSRSRLSAAQKEKSNFIIADARRYLKQSQKKYDCIIVNSPPPQNLALNRYFTVEFFRLVRERLKAGGVFSFRIPSRADILSPAFARFNSCIINSLDSVFGYRLLIPSDSLIVIASLDKKITPRSLVESFKAHPVENDYFTIYHLQDRLESGRINYLESRLDKDIGLNRDLNPRGFFYYSLVEQAKFYPGIFLRLPLAGNLALVIFAFLVVLAGLKSVFLRRSTVLVNAAAVGFTSIGLSALIFVCFQVYSGALFWKLGILTGAFMAGLSSGAFLVNAVRERIFKFRRPLALLYLFWFLFLFLVLVSIGSADKLTYPEVIFYLLSFLSGVLTGAVYPFLGRFAFSEGRKTPQIAAAIYSFDLAGAAAGTLVFSLLFIPLSGVSLSLAALLFLVFIRGLKEFFS